MLESRFNKVAGLQTCNFIIKRLRHKCFLVKFAKYLRTSILQNICQWLLLWIQLVWINTQKQLLILNTDGRDFTRQIKIHQIFWDFLWCSPATLLRRDFGTGVSCQFYKIFHFTFFEEPFHCCITTRYFQNIWRSFIQSRHLTTKMGVKQQKS